MCGQKTGPIGSFSNESKFLYLGLMGNIMTEAEHGLEKSSAAGVWPLIETWRSECKCLLKYLI